MKLKDIDDRLARLEGHIATAVLLAMILVASIQALLFNVAERGASWAARALSTMSWADTFLHKGTLWIAFLGASLATHANRHIAVDALARLARPRIARLLCLISSLGAGLVSLVLAFVFGQASLASDATIPFEYEILTSRGRAHVCDASLAELGAIDRPALLCAVRSALALARVPISTGAGAAQLVVPTMFVIIGLRLIARGIAARSPLAGEPGQAPTSSKVR